MDKEFKKILLEMIQKESDTLIHYWLEYFDDSEKDEEYRLYDDFLGFFEECVMADLDPKSDEAEALKHFLEKVEEIIGLERFFNFNNSVYTCFLKMPLLRRLDEKGLFTFSNISPLVSFFESLTSRLTLEMIQHSRYKEEQTIQELSEREAPIAEIWDGIVMISIVGTLDSHRVLNIIDKVLDYLEKSQNHYVIIDISAIYDMNSEVANQLIKLHNAIHFMGATPMLTGITKNIAKSLTHLQINLGEIKTFATTKHAMQTILGK